MQALWLVQIDRQADRQIDSMRCLRQGGGTCSEWEHQVVSRSGWILETISSLKER